MLVSCILTVNKDIIRDQLVVLLKYLYPQENGKYDELAI